MSKTFFKALFISALFLTNQNIFCMEQQKTPDQKFEQFYSKKNLIALKNIIRKQAISHEQVLESVKNNIEKDSELKCTVNVLKHFLPILESKKRKEILEMILKSSHFRNKANIEKLLDTFRELQFGNKIPKDIVHHGIRFIFFTNLIQCPNQYAYDYLWKEGELDCHSVCLILGLTFSNFALSCIGCSMKSYYDKSD